MKEGIYKTVDGHNAFFVRDSGPYGNVATVLGFGYVGYGLDGIPDNENAPGGLILDLGTWKTYDAWKQERKQLEDTQS